MVSLFVPLYDNGDEKGGDGDEDVSKQSYFG